MSTGELATAIIGLCTLGYYGISELLRRRAKLMVRQRYTYFEGSDDDRTEIQIILRNLAHRPTGIYDVLLLSPQDTVLQGSGYQNRIRLPIPIAPWSVRIVRFRIDRTDEQLLCHIKLKDIDDNEFVLSRTCRTWVSVAQGRIPWDIYASIFVLVAITATLILLYSR